MLESEKCTCVIAPALAHSKSRSGSPMIMARHGILIWSALASRRSFVCTSFLTSVFGSACARNAACRLYEIMNAAVTRHSVGAVINSHGRSSNLAGVPPRCRCPVADDVSRRRFRQCGAHGFLGRYFFEGVSIPQIETLATILFPGAVAARFTLTIEPPPRFDFRPCAYDPAPHRRHIDRDQQDAERQHPETEQRQK